MDFVIAVVIGIVIGGVGGFVLRGRNASAVWQAPVLAILGAVIASIIAVVVSKPGYGWKEAVLQVVLALAGVGAAAMMGRKASSAS
jgi:hypothetical protein